MSITRVKKRITKTTLNSVSYATHKQLSDHSVKTLKSVLDILSLHGTNYKANKTKHTSQA